MESRLPATFSVSMLLHAAGVGCWLYLSHMKAQEQRRVLSNVELMIAVRPARAVQSRSTWNFLKMALPHRPADMPMDVQPARVEHVLHSLPKHLLEENHKKLSRALALDTEKNLSSHRNSLQAMEAETAHSRHSRASLAEAPRLEEVGRRRASKAALAMDALVEEHSSTARAQGLSDLSAAPEPSRRHGPAAMETLSESAAPSHGSRHSSLNSLASLLPSESGLPSHGGGRLSRGGGGDMMEAAPAPARREVSAMSEKKKAGMIEGPLKRRRILHYDIPKFPAWAQSQGILEAVVRIRFTVAPSGEVNDGMRLTQTSGYGEIDRLAMDTLLRWRFEPISEESGNQWGIITFRFVVE